MRYVSQVVIFLISIVVGYFLFSSPVYLLGPAADGELYYLHRYFNAYLKLEIPVLTLFQDLADLETRCRYIVLVCFSLFTLGIYRLLAETEGFLRIILSLSVSIFLANFFGYDLLFWLSVALLPLLLTAQSAVYFWFLVLALNVLVVQMAAPVMLVVLFYHFIVKSSFCRVVFQGLLATVLVDLIFGPITFYPDYPLLSRVVTDDGMSGVTFAFIGESPSLQVLDRILLKEIFLPISLILAFLSYISHNILVYKQFDKAIMLQTFFLSMLLILDCLTPESVAIGLPVQALSRIIPGGFLYPISAFFVALIAVLIVYRLQVLKTCSFALLAIFLSTSLLRANLNQDGLLFHKLTDKAFGDIEIQSDVISPSYAVLRNEGLHVLDTAKIANLIQFKTLEEQVKKIKVSDNQDLAPLLVDGSFTTGWRSEFPQQMGNEFIELEFKEEVKFDAFQLDTMLQPPDFPRGLRVLAGKSCQPSDLEVIYLTENWEGLVKLTKDNLPYYAGQDQVKVFLEDPFSAKCIKFEQTAKGEPYHWAVTEVLLHFL